MPGPAGAPEGLGPAGAALYAALTAAWEFDAREAVLVVQAARTADSIAQLEAVIAREGQTVTGSRGQTRLHPAVTELRGQRLALARLLGGLDIPEDDEDVARTLTTAQRHARTASRSRWRSHGPNAASG